MTILTRREFLVRGGALAAVSLGALACSDDSTGPSGADDRGVPGRQLEPGEPRRVVVVGAGLAGLVAAYELDRAGHAVTVLEARDEPGGRARTFRDPFADGLLAEAGPARIPPGHDLTLSYVDHFGLETGPFYPRTGDYLVTSADGTRLRESPEEFLNQRYDGRESWMKIPEGTDLLPRAFADALEGRIRLGSPVVRIARENGEVVAIVDAGAGGEAVRGDHLICTVPLPVIDRVEFDPPVSQEKRTAWAELGYWDVTRVYIQYERRIWEDDGLNGWGLTHDFELWQPSWDFPGPRGVLMAYLFNRPARQSADLEPGVLLDTFTDRFDQLFPGSAALAEGGHFIIWRDQPWIGGAFADLNAPSFSSTPELASPEGGIHFAGEHASGHRGWMQGALASGLRAAREVNDGVAGRVVAEVHDGVAGTAVAGRAAGRSREFVAG